MRLLARLPAIGVNMTPGHSGLTWQRLPALRAGVAIPAHDMGDPRIHPLPFGKHEVMAFVSTLHP